jgi:hypothetical protein
MRESCYRLLLVVGLALSLTPLAWVAEQPPPVGEYLGKVVPLADLAAKAGTKLDADAAPHSLVLVSADGKVWGLLKDGGARMFFKDTALLNRPMRLTARPLPGSQILRVLAVHSMIKGKPHEVYYWCAVCAIKRSEKEAICECCGGPMALKEEPVGK